MASGRERDRHGGSGAAGAGGSAAAGPGATAAPRLLTPAFVALTLAELAYFTAVGMMYSAVPLFVRGPLRGDELASGIAVGAFFVTALILRPFAGRLSDRVGRRPLLLGGALAFAAIVLAHTIAEGLVVLVVLRLLLGVAEAFFFVAGVAALADLAPPGREGQALSINSLALYLGIAFGPLVGELLIDTGGFGLAWLGAAGFGLLTAALVARLPETRPPDEAGRPSRPSALFHRAAVGPGIALFAGVAAMSGFLSIAAPYGRDIGLEGARLVLLLYGTIVVLTRIVFSSLPDRVPPMRLVAVALLTTGAGLAVAGVVDDVPGIFAGAAVAAVGVAFLTPAIFAFIFGRVRPSERGSATGTASLFIDLGLGGGPILVGLVASAAGYPVGLVVMGMVAGAGAAWAASVAGSRGGRRRGPEEAVPSAPS